MGFPLTSGPVAFFLALDQGVSFLYRDDFTYYALIPGLAIMWVVLGANLLGDGLRDRLDPRQRGKA